MRARDGEGEKRGTGWKFDIPVGDVCLVSERVWILLTGVDTPFRFPSTHCELSWGNAIERGTMGPLKRQLLTGHVCPDINTADSFPCKKIKRRDTGEFSVKKQTDR